MHEQPPLTWWSHLWRLAIMLSVSAVSWIELASWQWDHMPWWFWLDLFVAVTCYVLIHLRRSWPRAIPMTVIVLGGCCAPAAGPVILALFSISTLRQWRFVLPAGVLSTVLGLLYLDIQPLDNPEPLVEIPIAIFSTAVLIGWGLYVGSRRELIASLKARAEATEAEELARVARAQSEERTRIAREMHDVLAHRISSVALHAGALAWREDLDADQMRSTAATIRDNAHRALEELREVLGVLRSTDVGTDLSRPQPQANDIPELIANQRSLGQRIDTHFETDLASIDDRIGRAVYRVVQEGLTNAHKHAHGARVTVTISSNNAGLNCQVSNPRGLVRSSSLPSSGLGLLGLRERIELLGGTLEYSADPHHTLTVTIPLTL